MAARTHHGDRAIANGGPPPLGWRSQDWAGGRFVGAGRERTALVEGSILLPEHAVMVTLRGGASRHETVSACGARSDGPDRAGLASFLPAGCERRLRLHDVRWRWASVLIRPDTLARAAAGRSIQPRPFANRDDPFLFGLLRELDRLHSGDGGLDVAYCETMTLALAHYLIAGQGAPSCDDAGRSAALPAWKLGRVRDFVEAGLAGPIRIADMAALAGLSEGHFHRAFRAGTGQTPLQFVNQRRVEAAKRLLAGEDARMTEVSARVGFVSPSHFARVFRGVAGQSPSRFRRDRGLR